MTDKMESCKCPMLKVGGRPTENRNWNPDCPEHGLESAWWQSDEQKRKRDGHCVAFAEGTLTHPCSPMEMVIVSDAVSFATKDGRIYPKGTPEYEALAAEARDNAR